MAIVTHTRRDGTELTSEEKSARDKRLEAAAKRPYVYDPDCPLLTEEQLEEFRPANFASMEDRAWAMRLNRNGAMPPDFSSMAQPRLMSG